MGSDHDADVKHVAAALYSGLFGGGATPIDNLITDGVVVLGPAAADVVIGRDGVDSAVIQRPRKDTATLDPDKVQVGFAAGESSGWFWAFPTTSSPGSPSGEGDVERFSGVFGRSADGRWLVAHAFLSLGLPNERMPDYQQEIGSIAPVGDGVTAGAEVLLELLRPCLGMGRLHLLARRTDFVVIGSDPREVFEGATSYLNMIEPMREQARELEAKSRFEQPGGIRAHLTEDGQTGFVATNISATVDEFQLPTFRVSLVFSRTDDGFRLVCDHHGFPAPDSRV